MDFSEKWGKDIDEAVRLALIDLQLTKDQVNVIVLEEPTKGFFGIGSKLAKVRVEKKIEEPKKEEKPQPVAKPVSKPSVREKREEKSKTDKSAAKKEVKEVKNTKEEKETKIEEQHDAKFSLKDRPDDLVEVNTGLAYDFIKEITEKMGLTLQIKVFQNETNVYVEIEGKDSGTIIGKRGQTLDAMQYLTSLVVNKDQEKYIRVILDAENYREKREKTLEQLAKRLADKVLKTNRTVRLEPMNPYERKVIHATLQSNPKVTTRSEGEEPFRRVIIERK